MKPVKTIIEKEVSFRVKGKYGRITHVLSMANTNMRGDDPLILGTTSGQLIILGVSD